MRRLSYEWLAGLREIVIDPGRCPLTYAEFTLKEYLRDRDADGGLTVSAVSGAEDGRELVAGGRFCVNTCYGTSLWMPWHDEDDQVASVSIEEDMGGFALVNCDYWFSGLTALTTILADEDWELPSGLSGTATFYSCKALVGGNGTTYSSSRVSYRYMVIDSDSATGYLTAG